MEICWCAISADLRSIFHWPLQIWHGLSERVFIKWLPSCCPPLYHFIIRKMIQDAPKKQNNKTKPNKWWHDCSPTHIGYFFFFLVHLIMCRGRKKKIQIITSTNFPLIQDSANRLILQGLRQDTSVYNQHVLSWWRSRNYRHNHVPLQVLLL